MANAQAGGTAPPPVPSNTRSYDRLKRTVEIGGAAAGILALLGAVVVAAISGIVNYVESQINSRTRYNQAVLIGETARNNEQYEYAILRLSEAIRVGMERRLEWDDLAPAVDSLLTSITDSGEHHRYARYYNQAFDIVDKFKVEDDFYFLFKGYRDLFVRYAWHDAEYNFSIAIKYARAEEDYYFSSYIHQARALSFIGANRLDRAALDLAVASLCNPILIDNERMERYIRALFNEKWIKRWFDLKVEHRLRALEAASKARDLYPTVEAAAGQDCAMLPTSYWDVPYEGQKSWPPGEAP